MTSQTEVISKVSRIIDIFNKSNAAIRPHFTLVGPSGCGKSHTIQMLANKSGINFLEVNAAQLTKEGTAGNSLSKVLAPLANMNSGRPTICFVDEFDKLFISGNKNTDAAHETTNGVQNEFLRVLEADTTETFGDYGKFDTADVSKVLFIFAGAFNNEENISLDTLSDFGVKTEFLGRVSLVYNMEAPTLEDMGKYLDNLDILDKYIKLFPKYNKNDVKRDVMVEVERVFPNNKTGLRLLTSTVNQYFINKGRLGNYDAPTDEIPF